MGLFSPKFKVTLVMTSFSIFVIDTFRPVYLYLDIMTSYTLNSCTVMENQF